MDVAAAVRALTPLTAPGVGMSAKLGCLRRAPTWAVSFSVIWLASARSISPTPESDILVIRGKNAPVKNRMAAVPNSVPTIASDGNPCWDVSLVVVVRESDEVVTGATVAAPGSGLGDADGAGDVVIECTTAVLLSCEVAEMPGVRQINRVTVARARPTAMRTTIRVATTHAGRVIVWAAASGAGVELLGTACFYTRAKE